ncbi:endonuclease/exonuclease/phosphatase family protein [Fulvivirga sp.]|uniref:endonuclease/exonuclease/phosphatase family protein n=1 Tax=Fulvivirga sp. TaxID=1931237 RepID=UPI0032EC9731
MEYIKVAFQIGLVISMAFTSLQLIRKDEWWVRASDFPHLQTTVLTFIFFIGTASTLNYTDWYDWFLMFFGLITLVYQAKIIFPYTSLAPKQSKSSDGKHGEMISILECNVLQDNTSYQKLIDLVSQCEPSIVIALETDNKWEQGLSTLEADYPYTIKHPQDNTYGILVYSKLQIVDHSIDFLIDSGIPSVEAIIKLANNQMIKIFIVHPEPPSPTENERSTERDAELILIAKKVENEPLPVIVAGDLNDVAWSHTTRLFQRLSGLLDPRIGRGFFNTFNAKHFLLRWPLDHIFHSRHFMLYKIERMSSIDSDHFPMLIQLVLDAVNGKRRNGETEDATDEDEDEASDKLEEVKKR